MPDLWSYCLYARSNTESETKRGPAFIVLQATVSAPANEIVTLPSIHKSMHGLRLLSDL